MERLKKKITEQAAEATESMVALWFVVKLVISAAEQQGMPIERAEAVYSDLEKWYGNMSDIVATGVFALIENYVSEVKKQPSPIKDQ